MDGGPPPPPPPHGANPKTTGGSHAPPPQPGAGLPPGNYDIFIIPPHSAGGGFVYLPSLSVQRNSFMAGVATTVTAFVVWKAVEPYVKQYFLLFNQSLSTGGNGVIVLVAVVGALGWAFGQTQAGGRFSSSSAGNTSRGAAGTGPDGGAGPRPSGPGSRPSYGPGYQRAPPPPPNGGFPGANGHSPNGSQSGWNGYAQHGASSPPTTVWRQNTMG